MNNSIDGGVNRTLLIAADLEHSASESPEDPSTPKPGFLEYGVSKSGGRSKMSSMSSDTDETPRHDDRTRFDFSSVTEMSNVADTGNNTSSCKPSMTDEVVSTESKSEPHEKPKPEVATDICAFPNADIAALLVNANTDIGVNVAASLTANKVDTLHKFQSTVSSNSGSIGVKLHDTLKREGASASLRLSLEYGQYHDTEREINPTPLTDEEILFRSYEARMPILEAQTLLRDKVTPPKKLQKPFGSVGMDAKKGQLCVPMDIDVFIDGEDKSSSLPKFRNLARSSSVASILNKQIEKTSSADSQDFLKALGESDVVLQVKIGEFSYLPFYSSRNHIVHRERTTEAALCIEAHVEAMATGATTVVKALACPQTMEELTCNLKEVYQLTPTHVSGKETRVTFINESTFRVDSTIEYDHYEKADSDKDRKGNIRLSMAIEMKKEGALWIPTMCNCTYDIHKKRSKHKASSLSLGTPSPSTSQFSLHKAKSVGKNLTRLSKSAVTQSTGLLGTEASHPASLGTFYRSLSDSPALILGTGNNATQHAHQYSDSSSEQSSSASSNVYMSGGSSVAELTEDFSSFSSTTQSEPNLFSLGGSSYLTNINPAEAVYRLLTARAGDSFQKEAFQEAREDTRNTESSVLARQLRKLDTNIPASRCFSDRKSQALSQAKGLPDIASEDTLDLPEETLRTIETEYTERWHTAYDKAKHQVTTYSPELDTTMPDDSKLSQLQRDNIQKFLGVIQESKIEFFELSHKLDAMMQTADVDYEQYRVLILELANIKTRCNALNAKGRTRQLAPAHLAKKFPKGLPPLYEQLKLDTEVEQNSEMSKYMEIRQAELNAINLLCSVEMSLVLNQLSIDSPSQALTRVMDKSRSMALNTQETDYSKVGLKTVFQAYESELHAEQVLQHKEDHASINEELQQLFKRNLNLSYEDLEYIGQILGIDLSELDLPGSSTEQITGQNSLLGNLFSILEPDGTMHSEVSQVIEYIRKHPVARKAERDAISRPLKETSSD